jgi:hypothetical protein
MRLFYDSSAHDLDARFRGHDMVGSYNDERGPAARSESSATWMSRARASIVMGVAEPRDFGSIVILQ